MCSTCRFSINVLQTLCQQAEKRPLAGLVVFGNGQAARAVAMAGSAMQLPVLWAKGGTANLDGMHREVSHNTSYLFWNQYRKIPFGANTTNGSMERIRIRPHISTNCSIVMPTRHPKRFRWWYDSNELLFGLKLSLTIKIIVMQCMSPRNNFRSQ